MEESQRGREALVVARATKPWAPSRYVIRDRSTVEPQALHYCTWSLPRCEGRIQRDLKVAILTIRIQIFYVQCDLQDCGIVVLQPDFGPPTIRLKIRGNDELIVAN